MEKRRSQMLRTMKSIEEPADALGRVNSLTSQQQRQQQQHLLQGQQLDPIYRQGSIISRQSMAINGSQNGEK